MAQIRTIITNPHPTLRLQARALDVRELTSPEIQQLCDDMIKTMYDDDGIGLAAPQVNESIRLVSIGKDALRDQDTLPFSKNSDLILVNPHIVTYSWKTTVGEEGCLSVPGFIGEVERHIQVSVQALDRTGAPLEFVAKDYLAIVLQHELDHLNGILYIDRAKNVRKVRPRSAL